LIGFLFVLACLGVLLSTIAVWAHQTLLGTDRFVSSVQRVVEEPAVQAAAADRLATQIVTGTDIQGRVAEVLPPNQAFLAAPLASAVETFLERQLATVLASERGQELFLDALGFGHERLVRLLRSESDIVQLEGATVSVDLLPIAVEGLRRLQERGILPAEITLPDVTDPAGREAAIANLESRLGRDLPDDFALVPIAESEALARAQTLVRAFDIVTVVIVVVTILLMVVTVVLARDRWRMVLALALGSVVALALGRLLVRGAVQGLTASLAASGREPVLDEVVVALTTELASWSWILVVVGIVVAVAAFLIGRREDLASGLSAASGSAEGGEGYDRWLRDHRTGLAWLAAGTLVVLVLWLATTPELAILAGVAIVVAYGAGVLRRAADEVDEEAMATTAAPPTAAPPTAS
jgi:hypothetical protein